MKLYQCCLFLTFFLLSIISNDLQGQAKNKETNIQPTKAGYIHIIKLQTGTTYIGEITDIKDGKATLVSDIGELSISINQIKRIQEVPKSKIVNGKYWFPNPNNTRLLVGTTGYSLKKGEGYFQSTYVLINSVDYGLTDHISVGGGFSIIPGLDIANQLYFFRTKIGTQVSDKVHAAGGVMIGTIPDGAEAVGIAFGVGTYGSRDNNITAGAGYGFSSQGDGISILTLGGMARIGKNVALVSENFLIPTESASLVSYGIRFFGESLSVDLAFFNTLDGPIFPGIPYIDLVLHF